jgi:hypothetical protein
MMNETDKLKKLSNSAFDKSGELIPFLKQVTLLLNNEWNEYDRLVMNKGISLPFENFSELKPLIISPKIVKKIFNKHSLHVDTLVNISQKLETSPLAIESKRNNLLVFLDETSENPENPNLMCVINMNQKNRQQLEITEVRSLYFDNVIHELRNAVNHENKVYANQYTKKWLALLTSHGQLGASHITNMITELSKNPSKLTQNNKNVINKNIDTQYGKDFQDIVNQQPNTLGNGPGLEM